MKLSIEFNTDNAAFSEFPMDEVQRILTELGKRIMQCADGSESVSGLVRDINGNTVGQWSWE